MLVYVQRRLLAVLPIALGVSIICFLLVYLAPGDPLGPLLGDIAIAWETCMAEAGAQGKAPEAHVTHLIVHGVLHLLGYDHVEDEDAELMEGHEVCILASLGLSDPY